MITILLALATASAGPVPQTIADLPPIAAPVEVPFGDEPLADDELMLANGRQDTSQQTRNSQVAGVSNSQVNGTSKTGAVGFSDQAFQNISGLTIVNANSGNNVAMNAAMNVSISISPGN